jgi:hypothetical protein
MNERIGLWLYSIIENRGKSKWDCLGIHGTSPVYTIAHGDFAAVVSEEPMKKYPLVRDFLVNHQLVNEKVMGTQPVLPVRFCTIAESAEQILSEVLKKETKVEEFRDTLNQIRSKSEYGLRAHWKDLNQVFLAISRDNPKVIEAKERILKLPERQRHMALIDVGHVVKEALEEKNAEVSKSLLEALTPYAIRFKQNSTLGDAALLNAAFLVEQARQAEFDNAVDALVEKYESQMQFKYVGPVPPFNFVEIVIHFEEARRPANDEKSRVIPFTRE